MKRARREFPGASSYTDCRGVRRWRFRCKGFSAELSRDYGSPEFVRRYEAALARRKDPKAALKHGTINWLVADFYQSPAWRRHRAESTRRVYRNAIEAFREEHGHRMVAEMTTRHVYRLQGAKADTPNAANFQLRMIRLLMGHAIRIGLRTDDPTVGVEKYETGRGGFHTWQEREIARFLEVHPAGSTARLAFLLMLHTGAARMDGCRLGWQHVRDGRLRYRRRKTERTTARLIDIPVHPELAAELDALPRGRLTFLETIRGAARSSNGLGNAMRRWCDQAGLPECTSHGLRKACARRLAEAGATPNEIAAVTGHTTLKEVARYTAAASGSLLADAAFEKLASAGSRKVLANHPARFASRSENTNK